MENYYLKIGKIIQERLNGSVIHNNEIHEFTNVGIICKEYSVTKSRVTDLFCIKYDEFVNNMDNKYYSVQDSEYDNDRDKTLLLKEIDVILLKLKNKNLVHSKMGKVAKLKQSKEAIDLMSEIIDNKNKEYDNKLSDKEYAGFYDREIESLKEAYPELSQKELIQKHKSTQNAH